MLHNMRLLTFDIEEWYIEKTFHGGRTEKYKEFDTLLNLILDLLDEHNVKGTFFCVGEMGQHFPNIIKKIHQRGHEIGCHSNKHTWIKKMSKEEFLTDTIQAIDSLEQCIGEKVESYRAPAFSIGEYNKWAFNILSECGIKYDSSVFPAVRDFGGFPTFSSKKPCTIQIGNCSIKEFPIPTTRLWGKELAYSGGGYFRFFPLWFIKSKINKSDYSMTYFHIEDLLTEKEKIMSKKEYEIYFKESGTFINRYKRYIKSNLGKEIALKKLFNLVQSFDFINIKQACKKIEWNNISI